MSLKGIAVERFTWDFYENRNGVDANTYGSVTVICIPSLVIVR